MRLGYPNVVCVHRVRMGLAYVGGMALNFLKFILWLVCFFGELGHGFCRERITINVGHFPNVTHAQAVVGHAFTRKGDGWFEKRLGSNVVVRWYVYNAGPSAMEALLAGTIDMTYVGPSPAINAYLRTGGRKFKIIAGGCSGGAALLVHTNSGITNTSDFKGKRVLTPQLGNTQDVATRAWLRSLGYKVGLTGGDVLVLPVSNPDHLTLLRKGEAHASWTVEPWVSSLELEGGCKIFLEERALWTNTGGRYVTTHLVCGTDFLQRHPDLVKRWLRAHVELSQWISTNKLAALEILLRELQAETGFVLNSNVLSRAWDRLELTWDPIPASLFKNAKDGFEVGLFPRVPDLRGIYELSYLNSVLKELRLEPVEELE